MVDIIFCFNFMVKNYVSDPKTRMWSFTVNDYNMLMSKLDTLSQKLVVEKIPKYVLNCLQEMKNNVVIDFDKLDPVLSSSLLPFQVEGLM